MATRKNTPEIKTSPSAVKPNVAPDAAKAEIAKLTATVTALTKEVANLKSQISDNSNNSNSGNNDDVRKLATILSENGRPSLGLVKALRRSGLLG
jgi:cell division protein FtsB